MAGFPKKDRQKIIDDYLVETGRNMFVAEDFIDWLEFQPDHVAYPWFFSHSEAEDARKWRVHLARQMVSGLRVVARTQEVDQKSSVVSITVKEFPAYLSAIDTRQSGGGYTRFDPDDPVMMAELRRQGLIALKSWLNRYGPAFVPSVWVIYDLVEELGAREAS